MPQHLAGWINDCREIEITDRDLVKHGREQEEALAIDERNLDGGIPSEFLLELHGDGEPGKAASQNQYSFEWCAFHKIRPRQDGRLARKEPTFRTASGDA
jgi:hypothetical protein